MTRHLMPGTLLGLLALGCVSGPTGCKQKDAKAPELPRLDCDRFCKRTFDTCGREVFIKSGKLRVDKARLFKVLGLLKKVKAEGLETCLKGCGEHEGLFGDAAEANKCLALGDCKAFAACVTKLIH